VVNTASVFGLMAMPFTSAYCASKHAVVAISEMLQRELDMMGLRIGVTVACPGLVRTPLTERVIALVQSDDAWAEYLPADVPSELAGQRRAALMGLVSNLMEPEVAAERVLDAVEAGEFYALTHGDIDDGARHRVESILATLMTGPDWSFPGSQACILIADGSLICGRGLRFCQSCLNRRGLTDDYVRR
jgi:NAD(P)-dependent dehydrogenase (short-subunit alcohol dehydrogenase family)